MSDGRLGLEWMAGDYAVCRLGAAEAVPAWAVHGDGGGGGSGGLVCITRTDRELSIVAAEAIVPAGTTAERGWRALRVAGTLDFALVGVLSKLTGALAAAGVPVFAISTYDTDILLVKASDAERAAVALRVVADLR